MKQKYQFDLSKVKKILLNKGYKVYKNQKKSIHRDFKSFYYTSFVGIFLILLTNAMKTLYPHQLRILAFIRKRESDGKGYLIAHEPGCGKTEPILQFLLRVRWY